MNARAPRPVLYALLVLVSIAASATAQSGLPAVASPPSLVTASSTSFGAPRRSALRGGGAKAGGAPLSDVQQLDSIAGADVAARF
jgi:hypothetical protein